MESGLFATPINTNEINLKILMYVGLGGFMKKHNNKQKKKKKTLNSLHTRLAVMLTHNP